jgi:hypothetical protein
MTCMFELDGRINISGSPVIIGGERDFCAEFELVYEKSVLIFYK